MAKSPKKSKNKLPSGSYRLQVYDYTDADGKRHYKSFTAPTKKEAEYMAAQWKADRDSGNEKAENLTIEAAVSRYLDMKRAVLSPSTMRGYEGLKKNHFTGEFGTIKIYALTNADIQFWVSGLTARLSPKTVRNAHGLLTATLEMFRPDFCINTTLPARKKPALYCPNDNDIRRLLEHVQGTELEIAVLLAAFGPLRRGEICALEAGDISGNTVTVSKSMVLGPDKEWHIKQPKTYGSYRAITFPDFVIKRIPRTEGRIITATPGQITDGFRRAVKACGLPHFRFHDLRHYSASIMHAIGVPDQYILQRGGWSSDNVMKSVYRNVIDLESARQTKKINAHFEAMQHEMQHEGRKAL